MSKSDWVIMYTPDKRILKSGTEKDVKRYYKNVYKDWNDIYVLMSPQQYREFNWEF